MKANELMIGNFLRYKQDFPYTHLRGKIVKVCGIDGRVDVRTIDDGKFHESEHPNWLEPIPLTQEILEKNGWMKVEEDGVFYPKQLKGELPWIGYATNGRSWIFRVRDFCEIKYVHELQHCLKLVGIEKEIEL